MDVSRGHLFLAGGVCVAAVIAGVLATNADASQARDAGSAMPCNPGYHVTEVRDVTLPDGHVGAAQVCARVTGKASASPSGAPSVPTSPAAGAPVAGAAPAGAVPPVARVTVTSTVTVTVGGGRPGGSRVTVTVTAPARTVRVTVTAPAR